MLPPFLPSIVDIEGVWIPEGWPSNKEMSKETKENVGKIIDAWQGLTMNEGVIAKAIKRSILDSIDEGLIINSKWIGELEYEKILLSK